MASPADGSPLLRALPAARCSGLRHPLPKLVSAMPIVGGSERWGHFGKIVALLPLAATTSGNSPSRAPDDSLCSFPCSGSSRTVKPPTPQPASLGDVSATINQGQSGPCGPPLLPLRALPPTIPISAS